MNPKRQQLLASNIELLKYLQGNQSLTLDSIWATAKSEKTHLPFAHATDHDGKISSNSHMDYYELIQLYSPEK